jgi:hypothetical protein
VQPFVEERLREAPVSPHYTKCTDDLASLIDPV